MPTEMPVCHTCELHPEHIQRAMHAMPPEGELNRLAECFKLFGDPTRLRILFALCAHELCVCDLSALLGMTKSAVSHQLKTLRLANLVKFRKAGQVVYYSLADDHVNDIIKIGLAHLQH